MTRWEPDARGRLEHAAMELYAQQGFEQTTVAQIAERAGLTERTFFRHYADKREVLFGGGERLAEAMVAAVAGAPDAAGPLDAVAAGLAVAAGALQERHDFARRRQRIIAANPELQEREAGKLAVWARVLADALVARGVDEPLARLSGEVGIAVFRSSFERWIDEDPIRPFAQVMDGSLVQLKMLASFATPVTGEQATPRRRATAR